MGAQDSVTPIAQLLRDLLLETLLQDALRYSQVCAARRRVSLRHQCMLHRGAMPLHYEAGGSIICHGSLLSLLG